MFYFYNPHKNHLYARVRLREKLGNPSISKLSYFFQGTLDRGLFGALADKKLFPDNHYNLLDRFWSYATPAPKAVNNWKKFNNLSREVPIKTWSELDRNDVLVLSAKDLRYSGIGRKLTSCKCEKLVLSSNHYCHHPDINLNALSGYMGQIILFSEVAVRDKPIYRDYFPENVTEVSFGYLVADRFQNYKPLQDRSNTSFISGSISAGRRRNKIVHNYLQKKGFASSQGYREALLGKFENAKNVKSMLSMRSRNIDGRHRFKSETKKYYDFDLVEELNDSIFYVCPPDSFDVVPQLFFEAMACGCIIVANPDQSLEELGFKCGRHYVGLDLLNTDLDYELEKLSLDKSKLASIQECGLDLIKNFRQEAMSLKLSNFIELNRLGEKS